MPVIQPIFEISNEALAGIQSGELIRHGGVVYNAAGGIFEHLKDAIMPDDSEDLSSSLERENVASGSNTGKIVSGILVGLAIVGGIVVFVRKVRRKKKIEKSQIQKLDEGFNSKLGDYLDAIRSGNLKASTITALISDLERIDKNHDTDDVNVYFSSEQFSVLIHLIYDYTRKLAEANFIEPDGIEEPVSESTDDRIVYLHRYLEAQKQIYENVA